jgi:hypothetical protein
MGRGPRLGPPLRSRAAAHPALRRPLRGPPAQPARLQAPDRRQGRPSLHLSPQALQLQHADGVPADAPGCTTPPTRRRRAANAGGSASTSPPSQRPQTLEPFFLHSLAGFLNAQRRRPRAATPADNAGRPPTSLTASCPLTATKKLEGPMWRATHLCGQLPIIFTNETNSNIVDTFVPCDPNMYSHLYRNIPQSIYCSRLTHLPVCLEYFYNINIEELQKNLKPPHLLFWSRTVRVCQNYLNLSRDPFLLTTYCAQ